MANNIIAIQIITNTSIGECAYIENTINNHIRNIDIDNQ